MKPDASSTIRVLGLGLMPPGRVPVPFALPAETGLPPTPAYVCPERPGAGLFAAGQLRRLGRAQRMALVAAKQALDSAGADLAGEDVAVLIGSGLSSQNDTYAFLGNMIRQNEQDPMPSLFVNSVHNAMASQIALHYGFTGENHTFTHRSISFELALQQACRVLATGRARHALVCGVDEVCSYSLAVEMEFGWFRGDAADAARGSLPGEGAAALLLTASQEPAHGVRVAAVACRPVTRNAEVAFIDRTLAEIDLSLADVDFFLFGANGDAETDRHYGTVERAVSAAAGRDVAFGTYKQLCGEFCSASALGTAIAAAALRDGRLPDEIVLRAPEPGRPLARTLVYHLSPFGYHSACVLTS